MKKFKYALGILIAIIIILPNNTYASHIINFENLTIDDGLSQSTAEAIIQDNKGYIWIGTNDGLNRYNGEDIKVFKSDKENNNSIISNYITALVKDNDENLWVGTDEGLSKINLNNYNIKNYRRSKFDKSNYYAILTLYLDDKGDIYMGNNKGLYKYYKDDDDFRKILDVKKGLNDENIYSINKDKNNNLWLGTEKGLSKFNLTNQKVETYVTDKFDTREWGKIRDILFDNNENMWVGTYENGLKIINSKTEEVKEFKADNNDLTKLQSNNIRDILQDSSNNIWIATEDGLSKYIGNDKFTTYKNKSYDNSTLASNIVYKLIEDNTGLVWAGTYTGVSVFNSKNKIETYKNDVLDDNSLSDNVVMGVYEDDDGLLWIGTRDKGLNIINRENYKISHIYEGNSNYELTTNAISVITGKGSTIWVGTRNGVNKINKKNMTIKKYTIDDGLSDNNIKSLFIDSNNNLWIGTPKGLSILNIETDKVTDMTSKLIKSGIEEPYIQNIYEDKEGIFWIGGYISGGLIRFNPKDNTIKFYNSYKDKENEEEIVNTIRTIVEDENNNLWIGTNSGLLKFNKVNKQFQVYTEKDGLANNIVYQILVDKDKNLWMSTNNGISKFDIKSQKFTNLSSTDGLQSNEFNGNAAYKCKNGDFLFGGIKGLSIFNPSKVLQNDYKSILNFDSFEVQGKNYNNINTKVFEYNKNSVRIKYFINDYRKNSNITYYYKLGRKSDDWIEVKNNEVILEDLPSGKYEFIIKCRNGNGNMSDEKSIQFTIKPPFWRSNFAIIMYILIAIILIYNGLNKVKTLDKLVEKRTTQLNKELEKNKLLFDKLLEIEKSKNNYFINLSHELRTPLNVINSVEQLIRSFCVSDKEITKSKLIDYMDITKNNVDRLLNLINNIIDTSKIENGRYKVNKKPNDIVYIVEEAALSLKQTIENAGVELIIDTEIEEKIINCDKSDIERCIVNLVSNAYKFTPKGGRISIDINDLGEKVKIEVEDTGIGIDKKHQDIIFDRFNQIIDNSSEKKGGSGLGLTITKQIIDLHKGQIYVESELNKGTKFTIILPVD